MSNEQLARTEQRQLTPAQQKFATIRDYLKTREGHLAKLVPKYLDSERMIRLALGAASRNQDLLECTPESWMMALMDCAFYGLEPNPALGHAYLVPFKNKHKDNRKEVQFIPGYKGLILLARECGAFTTIDVRVVYENEFKQGRFAETPHDPATPFRHEPLYGNARGPQFGFYAVGWVRPGERPTFRFCPMDEIRETVKRARGADRGPWTTDFTAMAKKTAVRRLMSMAPIKPLSKLDNALNHERALQQGTPARANDWSQMLSAGTAPPETAAGEPYDPTTGEVHGQSTFDL